MQRTERTAALGPREPLARSIRGRGRDVNDEHGDERPQVLRISGPDLEIVLVQARDDRLEPARSLGRGR